MKREGGKEEGGKERREGRGLRGENEKMSEQEPPPPSYEEIANKG